jgi:hypothetical protein
MKQLVREVLQCYSAGTSTNESENATRRIPYDKFSNEKRDCHRRLWWNRRLDRKTTGERWIFGGRELRGNTDPAQAVVADLKAAGAQGIAVQADVAIAADVERLSKESMDAFGSPDVVVHCAGIMPLPAET